MAETVLSSPGPTSTASTAFDINSDLDVLYGEGAGRRVAESNVLVVGAGGVGCEVVKNLAFAGFRRFTVVDLDTIDVSNLNRQFLFRREHVSEPKAVTAAAAIRSMAPHMEITPLVANIKDAKFNITFFKSFNIVCNALDNIDARRHVNRMCLAACVPLIESGSTGYNGQVFVLARGVECYDCTKKPQQKSYAVCTIRSTPEKPVHCVVWAKSLWDLIFGPDDDGNLLADLDDGGKGGEEAEQDDSTSEPKKPSRRVRYIPPESANDFATRVCARVFVDDVNEQVAMKELWETRAPPVPYDIASNCEAKNTELGKLNLLSQDVWSKEECGKVVFSVLVNMVKNRRAEIGTVSFDKDDRDALAFVIAAANLRAYAYGVERSTPFHVKGIAGNIIHAVATTNAVVGGLVVLEALKLAANNGSVKSSLSSFVTPRPSGSNVKRLICPEKMRKPLPNCFVCSKGQLLLTLDTETTTLKMFVDNVLRSRISALEPSVHLSTGNFHNTLFECGQGLEDDEIEMYSANLSKNLSSLRVQTGSQFQIEDLQQSLTCVIHVVHEKGCEAGKPPAAQFILKGGAPIAELTSGNAASKSGVHESVVCINDDFDVDEVTFVGQCPGSTANEVVAVKSEAAASTLNRVNGSVSNGGSEGLKLAPVERPTGKAVQIPMVVDKKEGPSSDDLVRTSTALNGAINGMPNVTADEAAPVNIVGNVIATDGNPANDQLVRKKRKLESEVLEKPQELKRAREDKL